MKQQQQIKELAATVIHERLKNNISEMGERECAYFAGNLETMWLSFKTYVSELAKIELKEKDLLADAQTIVGPIGAGQAKVFLRECKQHVRAMNLMHQQTLSLLEKWVRTFERLSEEAKEYSYEHSVKPPAEK